MTSSWKQRDLTPLEVEVGILLVALRVGTELTQRDAAARAELYTSRVCDVETIKRAASVEFMEKYAAGLGYQVRVSLVPLEKAP